MPTSPHRTSRGRPRHNDKPPSRDHAARPCGSGGESMQRLEGKIALVTGGGQGVGQGIALALAA
ncbi:MAG: hypothetical protein ACX94A_13160, partial [Algiphilus sp.]